MESLKIESLRTTHTYDEIVEAKENALKRDWSKAFSIVKKALNSLRPFDIKRMLKLYDQAAAAKRFEGKDICLLLGHTGLLLLLFVQRLRCVVVVVFVLFFFFDGVILFFLGRVLHELVKVQQFIFQQVQQ